MKGEEPKDVGITLPPKEHLLQPTHFTPDESEARKGEETCPRSRGKFKQTQH